jgi:hypothetical protein
MAFLDHALELLIGPSILFPQYFPLQDWDPVSLKQSPSHPIVHLHYTIVWKQPPSEINPGPITNCSFGPAVRVMHLSMLFCKEGQFQCPILGLSRG